MYRFSIQNHSHATCGGIQASPRRRRECKDHRRILSAFRRVAWLWFFLAPMDCRGAGTDRALKGDSMSTVVLCSKSPVVRLTPFPRSRQPVRRRTNESPEGAREAKEARDRQAVAMKICKAYEAVECLTYAAEAVVDAGHHGKAGVILGVAANILIRSRFEAVTGRTSGAKPAKILTALRNCPAVDPKEADQLADALGGAATTSLPGLSRVVGIIRNVLDDLTGDGKGGAE